MVPKVDVALPSELFALIVDNISESVIVTDAQIDAPGPHIVYVNAAFEEMTGFSAAEVLGTSPRILQGPDTNREHLDEVRSALQARRRISAQTTNYRKDGTPFELQWSIAPYPQGSEDPQYFVSIQKDVTEELKMKKQSEQLTLLHSVWREVASAGLNLGPLRQRVAEEALRLTNAEAAVVEEPDGSEMIYRAAVGGASGQEGLRLPINRSLSGRCYSSRTTMVCEDAETDPWINTEAARAVGLRSGIVAPLVHQGSCYGVLKVYSSRPYHFSQNDVQLLDLSSGILAAALFDAAAFEEEIRKRQSILDATPILIGYVDQGRRYVEVNSAHEKLFQQPLLEIRGKPLWDVIPEETYNELRPYLTAALSGESVSFEIDLEVRGKGSRRFRGNLEPHVGLNGDIGGCYVALLDVTDARLADTDYLTGLPNRRHFERLADFTIQTRERTGDALSMLLIDIDHFKEVNDRLGHAAGDEVLKQFGAIISESCRKTDVPCRWGGEEFAILLDQCRGDEARIFAERLIEKIRGQSFEGVGNVTASIGVAEANETDTLQSLQGRADRALYASKHSGRNRVTHGSSGARPDARPGSAPD